MKLKLNRVAVVFDPTYGDRLVELAKRAHVWAVDSVENKQAAQRYIEGLKDRSVTKEEKQLALTVAPLKDLDSEFLETLEDHHGEYAQSPAWNELEVIGRALDPETEKSLEKCGFKSFEKTTDGFLARKGS